MFKRFLLISALICAPIIIGAAGFDDVRVYPNPALVPEGHAQITFSNLPVEAEIRLFDVRGRLILEQYNNAAATQFVWNLTNIEGNKVASGVYLYVLKNPVDGDRRTGKVAVIR